MMLWYMFENHAILLFFQSFVPFSDEILLV